MIEQIEPNKDVLRVVEKCIDVLLTAHEENWKTARLVAEGLSMPRLIISEGK